MRRVSLVLAAVLVAGVGAVLTLPTASATAQTTLQVPVAFDEFVQNTVAGDRQHSRDLRLGYSDAAACRAASPQGCRARSYLRFDGLAAHTGMSVDEAYLNLWAQDSWSCRPAAWTVTRTSYVDGTVQWGNQPAWLQPGAVTDTTRGHNAHCRDGWVTISVAALLQDVLASGDDSFSLALHAGGDNNRDSWSPISHDTWKTFGSAQSGKKPYLTVVLSEGDANTVPTLSEVTLNDSEECGLGASRRYLPPPDRGGAPTFRARVSDPDGAANHVRIEVELTPEGGPSATMQSTSGVPNAFQTLTWPGLDPSPVYTYRIRPLDINPVGGAVISYGDWTAPCEFAFDHNVITHPPIVEGIPTIVEEGETYFVLNYGESAQVTFRPHPDDVGKVYGYKYAFQQDHVSSPGWPVLQAGPDGSVTITLTNTFADGDGVPDASFLFFVRAVSVSGAHVTDFSCEVFNLVFE